MPRSATDNARIRDERRRQLLDAALGVFVEQGHAAARTADVARRAGLARGLVHYYFAGKDELFRAVCEEVVGATVPRAREVLLAKDLPAAVRLERFARAVCEEALRDPRVPSFLARLPLEPAARAVASAWRDSHLDALARAVADGARDGSLRPCEPRLAAAAFWGALVANLPALGVALPGAPRPPRGAAARAGAVDEIVACALGTVAPRIAPSARGSRP